MLLGLIGFLVGLFIISFIPNFIELSNKGLYNSQYQLWIFFNAIHSAFWAIVILPLLKWIIVLKFN